jgi:phosphatidylglycerophosphate synthase
MRSRLDPALNVAGRYIAKTGVSADTLTGAAFAVGLCSALMIAVRADGAALVLFILNRVLDGLDGAVARATRRTDRGGLIDIVCDFAIYGAVPAAFALREPVSFGLPAAVLLFSFYVNGATFLAFAAVAAKHGMDSTSRGLKSIYFTAGLMEGTETILFFAAMMVLPDRFPVLAYAFAGLTFMSAGGRMILAWRSFQDGENGENR